VCKAPVVSSAIIFEPAFKEVRQLVEKLLVGRGGSVPPYKIRQLTGRPLYSLQFVIKEEWRYLEVVCGFK